MFQTFLIRRVQFLISLSHGGQCVRHIAAMCLLLFCQACSLAKMLVLHGWLSSGENPLVFLGEMNVPYGMECSGKSSCYSVFSHALSNLNQALSCLCAADSTSQSNSFSFLGQALRTACHLIYHCRAISRFQHLPFFIVLQFGFLKVVLHNLVVKWRNFFPYRGHCELSIL